MVSPNNTNSLGESSDILLGKLLQHYVDDMFAFQHDLVNEDDYFNREEQCLDRLESIKATIAGDTEEIAICVDRAHTLIEFLQTEEEFPEKFHIGMVTASILTLEPLITALVEDTDCLDYLMSFVQKECGALNEVQSSQWSRVMVHLIAHSLPSKFFAQNESQHLEQLCNHLYSPSILNLVSFIIGVDPDSDRAQMLNFYVVDSSLIKILTGLLHTHRTDQIFLSNICTLMSSIVGAFSSLPSFATRFRDGMAPLAAILFDIIQQHGPLPSACVAQCVGLLGDLIKYDVRACKYEQLCSTRVAGSSGASTPVKVAGNQKSNRFVTGLFEHVEVLIMMVQQTRGMVLLRSCEALGAAVSNSCMLGSVDQVLSHDVIAILFDVFVSYRANEWVRHSCLDTFRTVMRGGVQFNQLREALFSTGILSVVPALYWNKPQMTRFRALGHMADLCSEIVTAATSHPAVRERLRNHVQWAKVLAFYGSSQQDEMQCGLDVDHMCTLFGEANALPCTSRSGSPRRCFMSPARSPGMSDSDRFSSSQSVEQEYFDTLVGHSKEGEGEEEDEDTEVRLVAEQLQLTDIAPSNADLVHDRTPIRGARPRSTLLNNECQKENSPPTQMEADEDDTPKKMVVDHQSVRTASAMGDTPQPKLISVSARSRTFYSRDAKSKSPFGKTEKDSSPLSPDGDTSGNVAKKLF